MMKADTLQSYPRRRDHALGPALLSALIPGLGQITQGRWVAAGLQFGTVAAYLFGAWTTGASRALWLALAWNLSSIIDAARHVAD